ncbi:MAG: hypothetical protein Q9201_007790 [Fulgogasparrea decipioides]
MRLSPLLALPLALASPPNLLPRQQQGPPLNGSTLTSAPALSSAAAQLAAQYLPTSLIPGFAIAIQSAAASASVTGDINSLVSSVLTATAPPDFLTAVPLPSQYSSRYGALGSQLSLIRSQASEATVKPTTTGSVTQLTTITSMGSTLTTSLAATVSNGSTSAIGYVNGTMTAAKSTSGAGGQGATSAGAGPAPTSSSSGGLAAATKVPLAFAAAGMMGLVGVAAVL